WGCGGDWKNRWSADDLAKVKIDGVSYHICPDCVEEVGPDSLDFQASTKTAAAKPKCPHCGSTEYGLMPSDFETAKCNKCGKNWNHGIVPGINDPKTAAVVLPTLKTEDLRAIGKGEMTVDEWKKKEPTTAAAFEAAL